MNRAATRRSPQGQNTPEGILSHRARRANNATAYDHLGTIRIQQGKLEEAASIYRALVRNQPSAAAHRELGHVLMRLRRQEEGQKKSAKAAALKRAAV